MMKSGTKVLIRASVAPKADIIPGNMTRCVTADSGAVVYCSPADLQQEESVAGVVHCKECKWWQIPGALNCSLHGLMVDREHGFCSMGEKVNDV